MRIYVIYENSQVFISLIRNYNSTPILIHEELVAILPINKFDDLDVLNQVAAKLSEAVKCLKKEFDLVGNDVDLIFSPLSYFYKDNSFMKEFDEKTLFNIEDVKRLKEYAKKYEKVDSKYSVVDFDIGKILTDEKKFNKDENISGTKLEISGESIVTDKRSYEFLKNLITQADLKIGYIYVMEHFLKDFLTQSGSALISAEKEAHKFILFHDENVKSFTVNIGTVKLIEKMYEEFVKIMPTKSAEEVCRKMQKIWFLETYDYDYDIIKDVDINIVIKIANDMFKEFYGYIFGEINRQNINITKLDVAFSDILPFTLIKGLEQNLSIETEEVFKSKIFVNELLSDKVAFVLKKICSNANKEV